jgi:ribosomal protein S18 acetylase RimI-like enzyme
VPVTISVADVAGADELHAALERLVPQLSQSNPPPTLEAVRALLAHPATTQFVARADDGSIVGVATLATFPIPTATRAWVEDVVVDEASSNQGIGGLLLDAMVARARELGAATVDLTSRPSREAANHLYAKVGFQRRDTKVYRFELG